MVTVDVAFTEIKNVPVLRRLEGGGHPCHFLQERKGKGDISGKAKISRYIVEASPILSQSKSPMRLFSPSSSNYFKLERNLLSFLCPRGKEVKFLEKRPRKRIKRDFQFRLRFPNPPIYALPFAFSKFFDSHYKQQSALHLFWGYYPSPSPIFNSKQWIHH